MNKKIILFAAICQFAIYNLQLQAQNIGINATGAAPAASAGLDVDFTNKGLLVPRVALTMTTAAGPVTAPTTSLFVYNTATVADVTPGYYYWGGAAWVRFSTGGDDWKITGNANATAGTNFLGTTNAQALNFRTSNLTRFTVANGYQVFAENDGTAALPFYSRSADPNTGMYFIGADILGFSTNAVERFRMSTTEAVFNDVSTNYDFRVESDLLTHMLFVDASTSNIGINTAVPLNQVHFESDGRAGWVTLWNNTSANGGLKQIYNNAATNGSRVVMGVTNYSASAFSAAAVMGLSLNGTTTGTGGIGVTGAANNESGTGVEGTLSFVGAYSGWAGYFNADVFSGGLYIGSDRRLKRDIKPITGALEILKKIEPVSYYMDTEKYPEIGFDENRLSYGFIAQDLEKIIPEMVKEKNIVLNANKLKDLNFNEERKTELFKVVNYTLMIPITVEAIKEQQVVIEQQNEKIEALEKIVLELKKAIENK